MIFPYFIFSKRVFRDMYIAHGFHLYDDDDEEEEEEEDEDEDEDEDVKMMRKMMTTSGRRQRFL